MNLDDKWDWNDKKLPCKVRIESGNPAADDLRDRLREMGMRLALENLKNDEITTTASKKSDALRKKTIRLDSDDAIATTLSSSNYNAPALFKHVDDPVLGPAAMNINKRFLRVPKSPPRKIMMDLQKERLIRTGTIPHSSDETKKTSKSVVKRRVRNSRKAKKQEHELATESIDSTAVKAAQQIFKPYTGDLFGSSGNYMNGMVYLSRCARPANPMGGFSGWEDNMDQVIEDGSESVEPTVSEHESWEQLSKELEAKVTCASTICAWSKHPANAERLAAEGALDAIMRLSKEDDKKIRRHCASAFRHMSSQQILCEQMIEVVVNPVLNELSQTSQDDAISRDCAVAMLNLTRMHGKEADLVEVGAPIALINVMNMHENLAGVCARGLFNLTCVDEPYQKIEHVTNSFLNLAESGAATLEVKHICASALCNLSDLKSMRLRLVQDGIVKVLGQLVRGAEAKTRRVCAIILQSLASTKSCRQEMVNKNAVQVLYSLSSDNDANTLHYVASAMMRLALEPANVPKVVNEAGVAALCNICQRCPDMPKTTQPCAAAFQVLSRTDAVKTTMVSDGGCVAALVTLLRMSKDPNTLQFSLLAFCNLLTNEENHMPVLKDMGVLAIIEHRKNTVEGIRESCALALFNLSCGEQCRKSAVAVGAVSAVMEIAKLDDAQAKMRCAATLCNLSAEPLNISKMVEEGVIPTFIDLLMTGEPETVKHCCAALCQLAMDSDSCQKIVELGAVPHIVAGVETGDDQTKFSCCSVLSALSFQADCRQKLVNMGALTALINLAQMEDESTRLRCALAFANLSCEPTVQGVMVEQNVLPILKMLSNSYSEENQMFVAKALCNLSCHVGSEKKMLEQDCVSSLMMIGMVRSVHYLTKQVCAKALLNLLNEDSLEQLCEEGLVSTISSFSKLSDEPTMRICAQVFNVLSSSTAGRAKLVEKKAALFGLLSLLKSSVLTTKVVVGKTICNLLCNLDSQAAAVAVGAVAHLEKVAMLGDDESQKECARAFFLICGNHDNRQMIVNVRATPPIILLARSTNPDTRAYAIKVIGVLALHEDTRLDLLANNVITWLVNITEEDIDSDLMAVVAKALCNLSLVEDYAGSMVQEGVVSALMRIQTKVDNGSVAHLIANCIRSMATCSETLSDMVDDGAIELLGLICNVPAKQWSESVLYDASVACFTFAAKSESLRKELVSRGGLKIVGKSGSFESCYDFAVSIMFLLSLNSEYRSAVASGACGELLVKLALQDPETTMTQNCSQALFMLSKTTKSRDSLVEAGLPAALVKLCKSENDDIKNSASQALKNLSSEGGDGLEEGTVSALIAMSEGATDNSVSNFDASALVEPNAVGVDTGKFGLSDSELPEKFLGSFSCLLVTIVKEGGGDAPLTKGPVGPPAPRIASQHVPHKPVVDEEVDQKNEDDEKLEKVMLYAKMNVPLEFQGDLALDEEDEEEGEEEAGGDSKVERIEEKKEERQELDQQEEKNEAGFKKTSRENKGVPMSPPLPVRTETPEKPIGPKEKQAKARRKRRSMQAKKKREAAKQSGGDSDLSFEQQAQVAGLY
ncbi:hypothetical protein TrCOL_g2892 [Triparma columacea]|uniref:Vacuolar protein 8 n=1 Tax=Triparma columacea TaxID=722753 RepID=A0A9W7GBY7_9STRA|nr:hypothetical protein TrCOL_g2892 [Triparma columacea]